MKRVLPILLVLMVAVGFAAVSPVLKFKAGTGLSVAITDTTVTYSLSAGTQRDIEFNLYSAKNFSGGAAETTWFYNTRNHYARPLTLNSTPDRFKMMLEWSGGQDDHGPTAFSIPAIQTDSAIVLALTRINTQPGGAYGLTIFARPANTGMSWDRVITGGNNPLEAIVIDNSNFPDSGTTTQMQLVVRERFP